MIPPSTCSFPRLAILTLFLLLVSSVVAQRAGIRRPVDTIGFAQYDWQMDSVMARINRQFGKQISQALSQKRISKKSIWKIAICPHDDYAYAGWMYPLVLENVKAPTVILIGVAHKARQFGIEGQMVFDSHQAWQAPYGPVRVSVLRDKITNQLPRNEYIISDSLQDVEHSLEALIPFLQYFNPRVEIIPILIPAMSMERMEGLAGSLAWAISKVMDSEDLEWMKDIAFVISNDAVHYGCENWGGYDMAPYGCGQEGYEKAVSHEKEIIDNCLTGGIVKMNIKRFQQYTVQDTNFRIYKWTWCGRFSVPFGLLTAFYLQQHTKTYPPSGTLIDYSTSIDHPILPVEDLGMGITAPANIKHWVGYAAIGYR
ncbi:MAG: AmmeMemoRadiSam system protein B [Bacteroidetes bacterium]|nr:MAG: AmmeMemoRadiSam system protein B [Bacteroidota bacterium]